MVGRRIFTHTAAGTLALVLVGGTAMAQCDRVLVEGTNLVGLPTLTPLANAGEVCEAFGQAGSASTTIRMYTGSAVLSWVCSGVGAGFLLRADEGIGLEIIESGPTPGAASLEGDHDPDTVVTIPDAGQFPAGRIVYAYPYDYCKVDAKGVCTDADLTVGAAPLLVRYGPAGSVDGTYTCDQIGNGFPLRFCGEGVLIRDEFNGPKEFTPSIPPCE